MATTPTTPTPASNPVTAASTGVGQQTGTESSLSNWAGPYVTEMLGRGQALASTPYQAYSGPLTAGQSGLQSQAFQGLAGLAVPGAVGQAADTAGQAAARMGNLSYTPTDITTGQFTSPGVAQQYMNPYLSMSLDPQIAEARRQSEIQNLQNRTALTKAGAFGGGRGALMESEAQRNLQSNLANITGQGYNTAYQQAQQAFTADQARALQAQQMNEQGRQFGAGYGLQGLQAASQAAATQGQLGSMQNQIQSQNLQTQLGAGAVQRGIEQEGLTADMGQFKEERDFPYKQTQYMQSLLQGLPLQAQSYSYSQPSALSNMLGESQGIMSLYDMLFGEKKTAAPTTPAPTTPVTTP